MVSGTCACPWSSDSFARETKKADLQGSKKKEIAVQWTCLERIYFFFDESDWTDGGLSFFDSLPCRH